MLMECRESRGIPEDRPRVKNLGIFPEAKMELTDLTNLTEEGSSADDGEWLGKVGKWP